MKHLVRLYGICALILCSIHALGAVIKEIEVKTEGDTPVPQSLVAANMVSRIGAEFNPEILSEDLKRLYLTGRFEDVRTGVEQLEGDNVKIIVWVKPKRLVREIMVEGADELSIKKIRELIEHAEEVPLNETQVALDANAIRDKYRESGFHDATVRTVVQDIPNTNKVNLIYRIYEGDRYKVRSVEFEGNAVFSAKDLRKKMKTRHSWLSHLFRTGYLDNDQLDADIDALGMLYKMQ